MSVSRALNDARDITHNLRTAIIGADGKLVKVYTGNDWTPDQVLADLKKLDVKALGPSAHGLHGARTAARSRGCARRRRCSAI